MWCKRKFETLNLIEIDSQRLLANYDYFVKLGQTRRSARTIWPVLKSNAYGHGIKEVAEILERRKFEYLVVDGYQEFLKIREVSNRPVLIIGSIIPNNFPKMKWKNLTLMVQDEESIKALGKLKKRIKIHLKVNTGMNRQGVEIKDLKSILALIRKYKSLELEGLMSHLADADNSDNRYTLMQLDRFIEAIEIVEDEGINLKWRHLAATVGAEKIKNPEINAVRLGLGLYEGVLSFKSHLTKIRKIKKGEKVSYNCTYEIKKDTTIGVIPVGYFEGLDRRLSNCGWVKIKNKYCPIIGRVCMNLAIIDLGKTKAKLFDEVEIFSKNSKDRNSIGNEAGVCRTIPYELLVKLNSSMRRVVK